MTRETYRGRKLKVTKDRLSGLTGSINGQQMQTSYGVPAQKIIEQLRRDIDFVDQEPINGDRWGAYMYADGTYELCDNGHPKTIGEPCLHSYCQRTAKKA